MTQINDANVDQQTEQQFKEWSQKEYVKMNKFCLSKGYQMTKLDQSKCQTLPPTIAIWYVKTTDKNVDLWGISGDLPTDIVKSDIAKNARQVLRHFSLAWQMQAANLENGVTNGKVELQDADTQLSFAKQLIEKAEGIYELYNSDPLWAETGLTK